MAKEESAVLDNLSREELTNRYIQLAKQYSALVSQTQDIVSAFRRLDYLFKVVASNEKKDVFPMDFYQSCIEEIMKIMIVPNEQEAVNEEESKEESESSEQEEQKEE